MESKNKENLVQELSGQALPEVRRSFTDPETGAKVKVTDEMEGALYAHEQQIAIATVQMAFSLKAIRDQRLYLLRGCESMKEYIQTCIAKSYSSAKFYMQIADALEGVKNAKQLRGLSIGQLGDISRDLTLVEKLKKGEAEISGDKIVYADGTEESFEEHRQFLRKEIQKEFKKDIEKATSTTAKVRNDLSEYRKLLEVKNQDLIERDEKIAELRRMVDEVSQAKDIDPRKLRAINSKKEASELIRSVNERALEALGELSGLPHEIFDAEIVGFLQTCVASIETGIKKLRSDFKEIVHLDLSEVN